MRKGWVLFMISTQGKARSSFQSIVAPFAFALKNSLSLSSKKFIKGSNWMDAGFSSVISPFVSPSSPRKKALDAARLDLLWLTAVSNLAWISTCC